MLHLCCVQFMSSLTTKDKKSIKKELFLKKMVIFFTNATEEKKYFKSMRYEIAYRQRHAQSGRTWRK